MRLAMVWIGLLLASSEIRILCHVTMDTFHAHDGTGIADVESEEAVHNPTVKIHSPTYGENITEILVVNWEVLFFDINEGYVEIELDGEVVDTPLPFDLVTGNMIEPELAFARSSGSLAVPSVGPHQIVARLYSWHAKEISAESVHFFVTPSAAAPVRTFNYTAVGYQLALHQVLLDAVARRVSARTVFDEWFGAWPPGGGCVDMRPVEGFGAVGTGKRPTIVYVCPPQVCGGTLDWMRWQDSAAAACGAAASEACVEGG
mmetsp:Transcript_13568/g.37538  ORF Transcript_13568/g.37538 Transcript_13568/m.37538 type:complete len:260 (+) Transcript_13568:25-804(+)